MMNSRSTFRIVVALFGVAVTLRSALAQTEADTELAPPVDVEFMFDEFIVLPKVGIYGRSAIHVDAIDAVFARGDWKMPTAGEMVEAAGGRNVKWRSAQADGAGTISTRLVVGGYAATQFESDAPTIMLLDATGHAAVYVNGELHAGDPYAMGGFRIPVRLRKGINEFVFHVAQLQLSARLVGLQADDMLSADNATLPSVLRQEGGALWGAVPVLNAADVPLEGTTIVAQVAGHDATETPLSWLDAVSTRNAQFEFTVPENIDDAQIDLELRVVRGEETLAVAMLTLEVVDSSDLHVRTFRSRIDGSVQSYTVLPAAGDETLVRAADQTPGCIVALHGAGESAREFAAHYEHKTWAHVIAPTGRGRYGFDWEDWARTDALEALDDAKKHLPIDDRKLYVTGHAMGGHGALVLAATEPERFAAVGTSAAWSSLWTYGGGMPTYRNPTPIQEMLARGATQSDTLRFAGNLRTAGVYLLHGAADERVPVEQSRLLLAELTESHDDFAFNEKSEGGNWWGNSTVDWPEMMDFFAARRRADDSPGHVSFATADLGISATSHWATIAGQERAVVVSRVQLERRDAPLSIVGSTENVSRLSIDKSAVPAKSPFVVRLDGGRPVRFRGMPASGRVWLAKEGDRWKRVFGPKKSNKGPARYGGFKAVFNHQVLLVYGTVGTEEENAWSRAKARFDAETFWYRGNGAIDVIPDTEFQADEDRDRNVVLYGNADTNSAWPTLLSTSPVQVFRDRAVVATRPESGDAIGFLMVRPRSGSATALVGVVGGTGLPGMRLTNRLRYFVSGIAYPDLVILGPSTLVIGDRDVRAAGYFNEDWSAVKADIVWRDLAL
ncbi:MAG: prolyl oligopeptidase family serine peptidase [Aeoliella sp.]